MNYELRLLTTSRFYSVKNLQCGVAYCYSDRVPWSVCLGQGEGIISLLFFPNGIHCTA